jgi:replicative DNA helicase
LKYTDLITQRSASILSWDRLNTNRNREWDLYGYDTGLHPLNMAIGGLIPTRVTVIGGRSGTGKTALTAPMFDAALRTKADGSRLEYLFFTWELDPTIVVDRSICANLGLTLRQLNQGAKLLSEKTMTLIRSAYDVTSKYPITYHTHSTDINEVKAIGKEFVQRCKEKSKVEGRHIQPVICIDYLNMAQFESAGLRTYGISEFMNGLKQFCNHERAAAVVFAQLSRETDKQNKIPDRSDFSDSASIENSADNLVIMYRPEYHKIATVVNPDTGLEEDSTGKMLIRVLKGRDYGIGDFLIRCDIKHFRFWDYYQKPEHEYWKEYTTEDFWLKEFGLTEQQHTIQEHLF